MTDVGEARTPQEGALVRAVITDWSRDNREWPVSVGDAEKALDSLLAYIKQLEGERDEARRKYTKALDRIDGIETQPGNFLEPATPSVLSDPDQTSGAASEGNEGALGVAVQRAEAAERENERLRGALWRIAECAHPDPDWHRDKARSFLVARTEERTDA